MSFISIWQKMRIAFSGTWHLRWAVLLSRAPDAQLALLIAPPTLDFALRCDHARVVAWPQGHGHS
jgi:hypothetical protein